MPVRGGFLTSEPRWSLRTESPRTFSRVQSQENLFLKRNSLGKAGLPTDNRGDVRVFPCALGTPQRWDGSLRRPLKRSEEHTSELQSLRHLVCRLLLEKKKYRQDQYTLFDNRHWYYASLLLH